MKELIILTFLSSYALSFLPKGIENIRLNGRHDGKYRTCNMVYNYQKQLENTSLTMIAPSRTYIPNKFQIFNIYGNVAEMVSEPHVAMGGSFLDRYEEIVPTNKAVSYEGAERWLGFRCVAEIYDK